MPNSGESASQRRSVWSFCLSIFPKRPSIHTGRPGDHSELRSDDDDDDDDDNDDDDVFTLALFPEILPVVTEQAVTKCISMGENKQAQSSAHGSINHTSP